MTDLIQKQQLFVQDDIATRLNKIANNLGAIKREAKSNPDLTATLIRESLFFIEWTAPSLVQVDAEQATELVELGRTLAHWQYNWEKIRTKAPALSDIAALAGNLSEHNIFNQFN